MATHTRENPDSSEESDEYEEEGPVEKQEDEILTFKEEIKDVSENEDNDLNEIEEIELEPIEEVMKTEEEGGEY